MGFRMLLYIPLFSAIGGIVSFVKAGPRWFLFEIICSVVTGALCICSLYFIDAFWFWFLTFAVFVIAFVIPAFLRRYVSRNLMDTTREKTVSRALWLLQILVPSIHTRSIVKMWKAHIRAASGDVSEAKEAFADLYRLSPPQAVRELVVSENLRALLLCGKLEEVLSIYEQQKDSLNGQALSSARFLGAQALIGMGRLNSALEMSFDGFQVAPSIESASLFSLNVSLIHNKLLAGEQTSESDVRDFTAQIDAMNESVRKALSNEEVFYASTVTRAMMCVLVGAFLLQTWSGDGSVPLKSLVESGAFMPALVLSGEYFRLVTAVFLHGGILHLGFNLLGLKLFGPFIETRSGMAGLVGLFTLSAIAGNFSGMWPEPTYMIAVGASGGVMGILGASLGFWLLDRELARDPQRKERLKSMAFILVANYCIGEVEASVFNGAHMWGFAAGFLLSVPLCLKRKSVRTFVLGMYLLVSMASLSLSGFQFYQYHSKSSKTVYFQRVSINETPYSIEVPVTAMVISDPQALRVHCLNGTNFVFFSVPTPVAVRTLSDVEKDISLIAYASNLCFTASLKSSKIVLQSKTPQIDQNPDGRAIAFWTFTKDEIHYYDQIVAFSGEKTSFVARMITPLCDRESSMTLLNRMCKSMKQDKQL